MKIDIFIKTYRIKIDKKILNLFYLPGVIGTFAPPNEGPLGPRGGGDNPLPPD